MVNYRMLIGKAKQAVDAAGGPDAIKEKAEVLKEVAKGPGSLSDKAKAAAEVVKEKPEAAEGTEAPAATPDSHPNSHPNASRGKAARIVRALAAAALAAAAVAAPASAATDLRSPHPERPADYAVEPGEALAIADGTANVAAAESEHGGLSASVSAEPPQLWEVGYWAGEKKVVLVVVDGDDGMVRESWTGAAVSWPMARGRDGQFGHVLNSPWVWGGLALVFFAGLFDWRRRRLRAAHLDLLVLLSFGVSHAFFNSAEIGVSVPLAYPPLIYLLGRALWIGLRGGGSPLSPSAPTALLAFAVIALLAFKVAINVVDSGVIDVGYAGVVGADRMVDGEAVWGEAAFPENNPTGDTYGPANYVAYIPFEQAASWSGGWDELPAAHAAALGFDLLCLIGLFVLGRRLAGNRLGVVLAFAWAAYPYTAFVTQSNSNDSLLAALLIWGLVAFASPAGRGALLAVAAMTKFTPLVLAPLWLAGRRGLASAPLARPRLAFAAAFAAVLALLLAHPAVDPGLGTFWERTVASQLDRSSPFSIWGQADLGLLHTLAKLGLAGLVIAIAFVPRERDLRGIAALGAAATIGAELVAEHWFYLYIVWFLPLLLVAIAAPREVGSAAR